MNDRPAHGAPVDADGASWQARARAWEEMTIRDERRAQGSIWTPAPLAAWMAEWIGAIEPVTVLDPGAGIGNLLAAFPDRQLSAAEIDPALRTVLRARYPGIELFDSFWQISDQRRFQAIIANPPYINHAQIADKVAIHQQLEVTLPKTTNLALLFYARCWQLLADHGRMIFLMPTEFMQTRAGVSFKRFLLTTGAASVIIDLEDSGLFGDDVISTASLVLAEKQSPQAAGLAFAQHSGRPPYQAWPEFIAQARWLPVEDIAPDRRWRPMRTIAQPYPTQPLSALSEVSSGVITGNNEFFIRSWPEIVQLDLVDEARYCLLRPQQLPTPWFHTAAQIEYLQTTKQRRWLIAIGDEPSPAAQAFLEAGALAGVAERPTQQQRQPWWHQEDPVTSDFVIGNFRRTEYGLMTLTGERTFERAHYHCIPNIVRLRDEFRWLAPVLFAWLLAQPGQAALQTHERHAGNGLHTLRSGALKATPIPLLQQADPEWLQAVTAALDDLRRAVLDEPEQITAAKARLDQATQWPEAA